MEPLVQKMSDIDGTTDTFFKVYNLEDRQDEIHPPKKTKLPHLINYKKNSTVPTKCHDTSSFSPQ